MPCDVFRQMLLDFGWSREDRLRAAQVLAHLESCQACRGAAEDYERLREAMGEDREQGAPLQGWAAFEQRLLDELPRPRRTWRLALAAAVLLLVGGAAFMLGRELAFHPGASGQMKLAAGAGSATPPALAAPWDAHEIEHEISAFRQISSAFDQRTSWVLDANGASDVGLAAAPIASERNLLVLRLTMLRGTQPASKADLVIVPGQSARVTVPLPEGRKLSYVIGTSSQQRDHLTLWAEVHEPQQGRALAALGISLQVEPSKQVRAGQLVTSGGVYDLQLSMAQASLPMGPP